MSTNEKPLIIFDTDMDTDCDDAGALGLLLKFANSGKAEILAAVADSPVKEAAPCIEAIYKFYGVSVPIGAVYADIYENDLRFEEYRKHREHLQGSAYYNRVLADETGKTDRDYESAAFLYRKVLAAAEDKSVTVVCVGLMTAVAELFETAGDGISPLSGIELFRQKVKEVITMGNAAYPEVTDKNFNYRMDRKGTSDFFEKCPVPVFVSPDGTEIINGYSFTSRLPKEHPLRRCYEIYMRGENKGRSSWDLVTLLYAFPKYRSLFKTETHGTVRYDTVGRTYWVNSDREDTLIKVAVPTSEMTVLLENLLTED